jgi:hypothetical protein
MAAPITIRKRKMTVGTPASASADGGAGASADATVSSEPFPDEPSSDPLAAQPHMAAAAAAVHIKPSYTFYAILAIFVTLFFIGLLTIQWIEWTDFIPHFPRPIQTGNIVTSPS